MSLLRKLAPTFFLLGGFYFGHTVIRMMTRRRKHNASSDDDNLSEELEQAVQRVAAILGCPPDDVPDREPYQRFDHLSYLLLVSYVESRSMDKLDECIRLHQRTISLFPHSAVGYDHVLFSLAYALDERYKSQGSSDDLRNRIELLRRRLELYPPGHPQRDAALHDLGSALNGRYTRYGEEHDLEEQLQLYTEALELCTPGHPLRDVSLSNLACALNVRYARYGEEDDLNKPIELHAQALELRPPGHPFREVSLNNLASSLSARYAQFGKEEDLGEYIELYRQALGLCPPGHPSRDISLNNLASALGDRYARYGEECDLREQIELNMKALELRPPGHPLRDAPLIGLARALGDRYARNGEEDDLRKQIELNTQALDLRPPGHPSRDISLNNLANALCNLYKRYGEKDDLRKYIELYTQALELCPPGHPSRDVSLNNLANALGDRYARNGEEDDLREQVELLTQALLLRQPGHPLRYRTLNNLAMALGSRFARYGEEDDLRESIELHTRVLEICPAGHPLRDHTLTNLAIALGDRYVRHGKEDDLRELVNLHTQALELCPAGHPARDSALNNLACALSIRYTRYGEGVDLKEQVELHTEALVLRPPGHPLRNHTLNNLAMALGNRYASYGEEDDLREQIDLYTQALELCAQGHPWHGISLCNLVIALSNRYAHSGREDDLNSAFALLESEVDGTFTTENGMLRCALKGVDLADRFGHHSLGKAFVKAIGCLRRYLSIGPTIQLQYEAILRQTELAFLSTDAAAYFIGEQNIELAIELLDEGRSLLWSEMRRFRETLSPFYEERIGEALSTHYRTLCKEISNLSNAEVRFRNYSAPEISEPASNRLSSAVAYDGILKEKREKLKEYNSLLEEIRLIPGCEDFQTRRRFSELQTAAKEGPVIIINCSKRRSDVIIVFADRQPSIVPLEESFRTDMLAVHKSCLKGLSDMTDENSASADPILEFSSVLEEVSRPLWDLVICLVVEELKKANVPKGSRIWWCPTSFLTSLPLHAAGNDNDFLADHFISSYTPTLGALIDARRSFGSSSSSSSLRMLVVAQTKSSGLKHAKKEAKRMVALGSFVRYLDEQDATSESVAASLPSCDWAHFICHGTVSDNPFDSCLILHGQSKLSLNDIIKAHLPNAKFAFLAACHTAELNRGRVLQDEVLHLAAAMQFSGFRGVVGTMWQMEDKDGPRMAEAFYEDMLSGDEEDGERHTRAARALWKAMQMLKKKNVPMARWANYVHIGA